MFEYFHWQRTLLINIVIAGLKLKTKIIFFNVISLLINRITNGKWLFRYCMLLAIISSIRYIFSNFPLTQRKWFLVKNLREYLKIILKFFIRWIRVFLILKNLFASRNEKEWTRTRVRLLTKEIFDLENRSFLNVPVLVIAVMTFLIRRKIRK